MGYSQLRLRRTSWVRRTSQQRRHRSWTLPSLCLICGLMLSGSCLDQETLAVSVVFFTTRWPRGWSLWLILGSPLLSVLMDSGPLLRRSFFEGWWTILHFSPIILANLIVSPTTTAETSHRSTCWPLRRRDRLAYSWHRPIRIWVSLSRVAAPNRPHQTLLFIGSDVAVDYCSVVFRCVSF